jgi:hypothetical protein
MFTQLAAAIARAGASEQDFSTYVVCSSLSLATCLDCSSAQAGAATPASRTAHHQLRHSFRVMYSYDCPGMQKKSCVMLVHVHSALEPALRGAIRLAGTSFGLHAQTMSLERVAFAIKVESNEFIRSTVFVRASVGRTSQVHHTSHREHDSLKIHSLSDALILLVKRRTRRWKRSAERRRF